MLGQVNLELVHEAGVFTAPMTFPPDTRPAVSK